MPASHLGFLERNQQAETQNFFAEVALVQFGFENRLIKLLELRKRELGRQQLEPDGLIANLAFEPCLRGRENVGVIEREFGNFGNRKPLCVGGVCCSPGFEVAEFHQSEMRDADDALARVAINGTKGVKLFEKNVRKAGLLRQFATGGLVNGFIHMDEPAG